MKILLSVIVVNFNAALYLERCLQSLREHLAGIPYEICIVDNGSSDGSVLAEKRGGQDIRYLVNERNRGFAAALNQGFGATTGPLILWLNPDTELLDNGFGTLLDYLDANPSVGIVGPQLVNPNGSRQSSCRSFPSYRTAFSHRHAFLTRLFPNNPLSRHYLHSDWGADRIHETDWVSGACLLHRRSVLDKLGGVDERFFMYCEDVDFCLRTHLAGWTIRYHPGTRVLHHIGVSSRSMARRMILERHRSMWRYYRKHFRPKLLKDAAVGSAIAIRCSFLLAQNAIFGKKPSFYSKEPF